MEITGLGFDYPPQIHQRALCVSLLPQRDSQVQLRRRAVRLERQGFLEYCDGFGEISAGGERRAKVGVCPRIFWIERDRFLQLCNCSRQIGLIHQRHAQPVVGLGRARTKFHRLLEGFERMWRIVCVPVSQPQPHVELGIKGIALDGSLNLSHRGRLFFLRVRQKREANPKGGG